MDRARDAIEHLHVELREHEGAVDTCVPQVALRGGVHHVADLEPLDRLVLRHAPGAIRATDDGRVPATMLGAPVVAALRGHLAEPTGRGGGRYTARGGFSRLS